MKKLLICCVALTLSSAVLAAGRRRAEAVAVSSGENGARETGESSAPDIVKVKGVGTGETEEAALKDAYRDAVESAVGMYVDAEQAAKNDEIIKDEILTQSNAYIEDYDEIEKKKENGLVKIKILARVKRQEITKRISGTMKTKSFKVGGGLKNLHAQMTTTEKKSGDGAALLAKALEGVDPLRQLMEVSLATGEAVQIQAKDHRLTKRGREGAADEGMVELAYLFKFAINRDRYFKEFLPNLERVLTQVSEVEPREIVIDAKPSTSQLYRPQGCVEYQNPDGRMFSIGRKLTCGAFEGVKTFRSSAFGEIHPGGGWRTTRGDGEPLFVVLVTESNEAMTFVRAKMFRLDGSCADVVRSFENGADAMPSRRDNRNRAYSGKRDLDLPTYGITFTDADGKTLATKEITIVRQGSATKTMMDCANIVQVMAAQRGDRNGIDRLWLVTPFIGCHGSAYYQWCSFKIAKEDLPKIDSIKIELAK